MNQLRHQLDTNQIPGNTLAKGIMTPFSRLSLLMPINESYTNILL